MTDPSEIVAVRDRIAQLEDVSGLLKVKDAEIARLTAENERLDKTVGTLADEIQRLQSVVDAARKRVADLHQPWHGCRCDCDLCRSLRALDGEP